MNEDELVDIVNEDDKPEGTVTKKLAHERGLLHRTVIAEVIGSDGKWTLIRQASDKQDAGQLVSPIGGHVQAGETEEDALKREAKEEYGLDGDYKFELKGKRIFNRQVLGREENHFFILFEIFSDKEPVLNYESVGFEKFTKEELVKEVRENPRKFGDAFHFVMGTFYRDMLL